MVAEILGGALALVTAVALHGAVKIRRIEKDVAGKVDVAESRYAEIRRLHAINRDLRAELDRTHAALNAQIEIASSNLADASKWRDKVAHLRNVAASGGRAMHAKKKSKQAAMTEQLRCEIARNANDSAVEA